MLNSPHHSFSIHRIHFRLKLFIYLSIISDTTTIFSILVPPAQGILPGDLCTRTWSLPYTQEKDMGASPIGNCT